MPHQRPKGTRDLDAGLMARFEDIRFSFVRIAEEMGYSLVEFPVLESVDLFERSTGETTDVVQKQMYRLQDGAGRDLALRPEGTPGLVRAAIQEGWLGGRNGERFAYYGPFFRYERPQKGRYRQFVQLGAEFIGSDTPQADAETILLLAQLLEELEIEHTFKINTLGTPKERENYREVLTSWLTERKEKLPKEDQANLTRNPLRILDSKRPQTRALLGDAPTILDQLGEASKSRFSRVISLLEEADIPFEVDPFLVRGLDYYTQTVFEAVGAEGAQDAFGGGGRYDGLVKTLGGPDLPAVGFAAGVDRLAQATDYFEEPLPCLLIPLGDVGREEAWHLALELWAEGISVRVAWHEDNLSKALKRAHASGAAWVMILGENELNAEVATLRNMETGNQKTVPLKPSLIKRALGQDEDE
ncbi:histidine--tRNA ligase [bacterium]|nr:histidine--tRNA ligase [bacterium]